MDDDRSHPVSNRYYYHKTQDWLICGCVGCRDSRGLFTDLVKAAVREALAENTPRDSDVDVTLVKKQFYG